MGWNPLGTELTKASKVVLRRFIDEHRTPAPPNLKRIQATVKRYIDKIAAAVEKLEDDKEAGDLLQNAIQVLESMGLTETVEQAPPPQIRPQRIVRADLRPHH